MTRPWFIGKRDPALLERDLDRYRRRNAHLFPQFEQTPDLSRGEMRLAAEVALGALVGAEIPTVALDRALNALAVLARG